jgi:hypothetical protein
MVGRSSLLVASHSLVPARDSFLVARKSFVAGRDSFLTTPRKFTAATICPRAGMHSLPASMNRWLATRSELLPTMNRSLATMEGRECSRLAASPCLSRLSAAMRVNSVTHAAEGPRPPVTDLYLHPVTLTVAVQDARPKDREKRANPSKGGDAKPPD